VTEETWIIVGPTGGTCSPPHSIQTRLQAIYNKVADTSNWQAELGLEASLNPKGTGKVARGESTQIERPPVTVEMEPGPFRIDRQQPFEWQYREDPLCVNAQGILNSESTGAYCLVHD
jgi:hypothetical protein